MSGTYGLKRGDLTEIVRVSAIKRVIWLDVFHDSSISNRRKAYRKCDGVVGRVTDTAEVMGKGKNGEVVIDISEVRVLGVLEFTTADEEGAKVVVSPTLVGHIRSLEERCKSTMMQGMRANLPVLLHSTVDNNVACYRCLRSSAVSIGQLGE